MKLRMLQFIAVMTVMVFTTSTIAWSSPDMVYKIKVDNKNGIVQERYKGNSNHVVVHIQDAHSSLDAQKNVSTVIESLSRDYDISFVGVEGGSEKIDVADVQLFPFSKAKQDVADYFIRKGVLSGVEAASINAKDDVVFQGLEDDALFKQNLNDFSSHIHNLDIVTRELNAIELGINEVKADNYSPALVELDKNTRTEGDYGSFVPALLYMVALAEKNSVNIYEYVAITSFIESINEQQRISQYELEEDKNMVERLYISCEESLPQKTREKIHEYKIHQKESVFSDVLYWSSLVDAIRVYVDRASQTFPTLEKYIQCVKKQMCIDIETILNEKERLGIVLKKSIAVSGIEKEIVAIEEVLLTLKNVLLLQATSDEAKKFFEKNIPMTIGQIKNVLAQTDHDVDRELLFSALARVKEFYKNAFKRDTVLVENHLEHAQTKEASILVSGGFHTQGITKALRDKEISYIVVSPAINASMQELPYYAKMTGELFQNAMFSHITWTVLASEIVAQGSNAPLRLEVKKAIAEKLIESASLYGVLDNDTKADILMLAGLSEDGKTDLKEVTPEEVLQAFAKVLENMSISRSITNNDITAILSNLNEILTYRGMDLPQHLNSIDEVESWKSVVPTLSQLDLEHQVKLRELLVLLSKAHTEKYHSENGTVEVELTGIPSIFTQKQADAINIAFGDFDAKVIAETSLRKHLALIEKRAYMLGATEKALSIIKKYLLDNNLMESDADAHAAAYILLTAFTTNEKSVKDLKQDWIKVVQRIARGVRKQAEEIEQDDSDEVIRSADTVLGRRLIKAMTMFLAALIIMIPTITKDVSNAADDVDQPEQSQTPQAEPEEELKIRIEGTSYGEHTWATVDTENETHWVTELNTYFPDVPFGILTRLDVAGFGPESYEIGNFDVNEFLVGITLYKELYRWESGAYLSGTLIPGMIYSGELDTWSPSIGGNLTYTHDDMYGSGIDVTAIIEGDWYPLHDVETGLFSAYIEAGKAVKVGYAGMFLGAEKEFEIEGDGYLVYYAGAYWWIPISEERGDSIVLVGGATVSGDSDSWGPFATVRYTIPITEEKNVRFFTELSAGYDYEDADLVGRGEEVTIQAGLEFELAVPVPKKEKKEVPVEKQIDTILEQKRAEVNNESAYTSEAFVEELVTLLNNSGNDKIKAAYVSSESKKAGRPIIVILGAEKFWAVDAGRLVAFNSALSTHVYDAKDTIAQYLAITTPATVLEEHITQEQMQESTYKRVPLNSAEVQNQVNVLMSNNKITTTEKAITTLLISYEKLPGLDISSPHVPYEAYTKGRQVVAFTVGKELYALDLDRTIQDGEKTIYFVAHIGDYSKSQKALTTYIQEGDSPDKEAQVSSDPVTRFFNKLFGSVSKAGKGSTVASVGILPAFIMGPEGTAAVLGLAALSVVLLLISKSLKLYKEKRAREVIVAPKKGQLRARIKTSIILMLVAVMVALPFSIATTARAQEEAEKEAQKEETQEVSVEGTTYLERIWAPLEQDDELHWVTEMTAHYPGLPFGILTRFDAAAFGPNADEFGELGGNEFLLGAPMYWELYRWQNNANLGLSFMPGIYYSWEDRQWSPSFNGSLTYTHDNVADSGIDVTAIIEGDWQPLHDYDTALFTAYIEAGRAVPLGYAGAFLGTEKMYEIKEDGYLVYYAGMYWWIPLSEARGDSLILVGGATIMDGSSDVNPFASARYTIPLVTTPNIAFFTELGYGYSPEDAREYGRGEEYRAQVGFEFSFGIPTATAGDDAKPKSVDEQIDNAVSTLRESVEDETELVTYEFAEKVAEALNNLGHTDIKVAYISKQSNQAGRPIVVILGKDKYWAVDAGRLVHFPENVQGVFKAQEGVSQYIAQTTPVETLVRDVDTQKDDIKPLSEKNVPTVVESILSKVSPTTTEQVIRAIIGAQYQLPGLVSSSVHVPYEAYTTGRKVVAFTVGENVFVVDLDASTSPVYTVVFMGQIDDAQAALHMHITGKKPFISRVLDALGSKRHVSVASVAILPSCITGIEGSGMIAAIAFVGMMVLLMSDAVKATGREKETDPEVTAAADLDDSADSVTVEKAVEVEPLGIEENDLFAIQTSFFKNGKDGYWAAHKAALVKNASKNDAALIIPRSFHDEDFELLFEQHKDTMEYFSSGENKRILIVEDAEINSAIQAQIAEGVSIGNIVVMGTASQVQNVEDDFEGVKTLKFDDLMSDKDKNAFGFLVNWYMYGIKLALASEEEMDSLEHNELLVNGVIVGSTVAKFITEELAQKLQEAQNYKQIAIAA